MKDCYDFFFNFIVDCSCDPDVGLLKNGKNVGTCGISHRHKDGRYGPICYVNQPSTCKDLTSNNKAPSAQYSWEACTYYFKDDNP